MALRLAYLLLCAGLCFGAHAGEVYKWVDEKGAVHYGNVPPDNTKQAPKKVEQKMPPPTARQQEQARGVANRDKEAMEKMNQDKAGATQPTAAGQPAAQDQTAESECEAEIRVYEESNACFNRYRLQNGGVRQEAFQHCKETKRPACWKPQSN